jgi:hypothetical protein
MQPFHDLKEHHQYSELEIKLKIFNLVKCIFEKLTPNLILDGERLKTILLSSGIK